MVWQGHRCRNAGCSESSADVGSFVGILVGLTFGVLGFLVLEIHLRLRSRFSVLERRCRAMSIRAAGNEILRYQIGNVDQ